MTKLTIADFVESAIDDIEDAGFGEIVLVGHSYGGAHPSWSCNQAGIDQSARARLRERVRAARGQFGGGHVDGTLGAHRPAQCQERRAQRNARSSEPGSCISMVCRGPDAGSLADKLYPESTRMLAEKVSRRGMPDDIPRTWILTLRDRALSVKSQRRGIEAIGGVHTVIPMDTCHCPMLSDPERLAEILVERCRLRAS